MNTPNPREVIGANNPPTPIEYSHHLLMEVGAVLAAIPVVQSEDEARALGGEIKRVKGTLDEMEAARKIAVKPLNDQVGEINATYREAREPLEAAQARLKSRCTAFTLAEEARREAEAAAKRQAAEDAHKLAVAAQDHVADVSDSAAFGEIGLDIVGATTDALRLNADAGRATREAARAERGVPVKIAAGFGRALSLRTRETLIVDDAVAAVAAIGASERIDEVIRIEAKEYRRLWGDLPAGVRAETERSI